MENFSDLEIENENDEDKVCHFCGGEGCEDCDWTGDNFYQDLEENEIYNETDNN